MPDDCGLKPPIEALPQMAQERAIGILRDRVRWKARAGRPERGGMIARGLARSLRTPIRYEDLTAWPFVRLQAVHS